MNEAMPPDWAKFQVGQRVWCVDSKPRDDRPVPLQEGQIYTIRDMSVSRKGDLGFLLKEIVRPNSRMYAHDGTIVETGFFADRFRPLREQNIEVFRQMCIKSPKQNTKELETVR